MFIYYHWLILVGVGMKGNYVDVTDSSYLMVRLAYANLTPIQLLLLLLSKA